MFEKSKGTTKRERERVKVKTFKNNFPKVSFLRPNLAHNVGRTYGLVDWKFTYVSTFHGRSFSLFGRTSKQGLIVIDVF